MIVDFSPLFKTIKKKKITQYKLINEFGISANTLSRMKHGENVSFYTIVKLCKILDCDIKDIASF